MLQCSKEIEKIWFGYLDIPLLTAPSSTYIRCSLAAILKNLLPQSGNSIIIESPQSQAQLPDIGEFLQSIQKSDRLYKASVSRQLATDLPPDAETTLFPEEPKDWFIKTADFGDDCDRVLQHRDGEFTQLLEDITRYHQIFQQGYDKIILLRPTIYTGYDLQLTAAMQCLGYSKEQFQFIIVQPIKLCAFHKPSQQINPIPDLAPEELIKAVGMDALRWHSLRTPLTAIAPINISTAGQSNPEDSLYRVQSAYLRCASLLPPAEDKMPLDMTAENLISLTAYTGNSPQAQKLASQLRAVPQVLQQSAQEIAPQLVCHYLEAISSSCHQWCNSLIPIAEDYPLLLATKQTIADLLENILNISLPE